MRKNGLHMMYFGKFSDQILPYGHCPPFGQDGLPKTPFKKWFCGDFPEKTRFSIKHIFLTKNSHRNHNIQVRIDSICCISGNFQTKNVCTVILHILDRTDCPKHHLKNSFVGIFPKIPKRFFSYISYINPSLLSSDDGGYVTACERTSTLFHCPL